MLSLIPFFKIFTALLVGVVIGVNIPITISMSILFALLPLILIYFTIPNYRVLTSYMLLISLGSSLVWLQQKETIPLNRHIKERLTVSDTTSNKNIYICDLTRYNEPVALIWKARNLIGIGDTIDVTIIVEDIQFAHFSMKKIVNNSKINFSAKVIDEIFESRIAEGVKGKNGSNYSISQLAKRINNWCKDRLFTLDISSDNIAIINGMILGNKEDITKKQQDTYQTMGISHILAISGMHITILFSILNTLLILRTKSFYPRLIFSIFIILVLWVYTIVVGSPISAVRATIMFTILQFSVIKVFSQKQIFNTLFATATLLVLVDYTLIYDVGFQLSFIAMLSILIFMPVGEIVTSKIGRTGIINKVFVVIANVVLISIAAQILTTPLTLYYFNYLSLVSILGNIVASFTVVIIIFLSIIYIILQSDAVGVIIEWIFEMFNLYLKFISELPYSHIDNISFSITDIFLYYIIIYILLLLNSKIKTSKN